MLKQSRGTTKKAGFDTQQMPNAADVGNRIRPEQLNKFGRHSTFKETGFDTQQRSNSAEVGSRIRPESRKSLQCDVSAYSAEVQANAVQANASQRAIIKSRQGLGHPSPCHRRHAASSATAIERGKRDIDADQPMC